MQPTTKRETSCNMHVSNLFLLQPATKNGIGRITFQPKNAGIESLVLLLDGLVVLLNHGVNRSQDELSIIFRDSTLKRQRSL